MNASAAPTIDVLRKAISAAVAEGFEPKAMVLRLSRRDHALLKRSPTVATHEVKFADGQMHFLDVRISAEPAENSHLDRTGRPDEPPPEPVVKPKKTRAKPKAKVTA